MSDSGKEEQLVTRPAPQPARVKGLAKRPVSRPTASLNPTPAPASKPSAPSLGGGAPAQGTDSVASNVGSPVAPSHSNNNNARADSGDMAAPSGSLDDRTYDEARERIFAEEEAHAAQAADGEAVSVKAVHRRHINADEAVEYRRLGGRRNNRNAMPPGFVPPGQQHYGNGDYDNNGYDDGPGGYPAPHHHHHHSHAHHHSHHSYNRQHQHQQHGYDQQYDDYQPLQRQQPPYQGDGDYGPPSQQRYPPAHQNPNYRGGGGRRDSGSYSQQGPQGNYRGNRDQGSYGPPMNASHNYRSDGYGNNGGGGYGDNGGGGYGDNGGGYGDNADSSYQGYQQGRQRYPSRGRGDGQYSGGGGGGGGGGGNFRGPPQRNQRFDNNQHFDNSNVNDGSGGYGGGGEGDYYRQQSSYADQYPPQRGGPGGSPQPQQMGPSGGGTRPPRNMRGPNDGYSGGSGDGNYDGYPNDGGGYNSRGQQQQQQPPPMTRSMNGQGSFPSNQQNSPSYGQHPQQPQQPQQRPPSTFDSPSTMDSNASAPPMRGPRHQHPAYSAQQRSPPAQGAASGSYSNNSGNWPTDSNGAPSQNHNNSGGTARNAGPPQGPPPLTHAEMQQAIPQSSPSVVVGQAAAPVGGQRFPSNPPNMPPQPTHDTAGYAHQQQPQQPVVSSHPRAEYDDERPPGMQRANRHPGSNGPQHSMNASQQQPPAGGRGGAAGQQANRRGGGPATRGRGGYTTRADFGTADNGSGPAGDDAAMLPPQQPGGPGAGTAPLMPPAGKFPMPPMPPAAGGMPLPDGTVMPFFLAGPPPPASTLFPELADGQQDTSNNGSLRDSKGSDGHLHPHGSNAGSKDAARQGRRKSSEGLPVKSGPHHDGKGRGGGGADAQHHQQPQQQHQQHSSADQSPSKREQVSTSPAAPAVVGVRVTVGGRHIDPPAEGRSDTYSSSKASPGPESVGSA